MVAFKGSYAGPLIFLSCIAFLYGFFSDCLPPVQGYSDDSEIYMLFSPDDISHRTMAIACLESCIDIIQQWMLSHYLAINYNKTEIFVAGTHQKLNKLDDINIKVSNCSI